MGGHGGRKALLLQEQRGAQAADDEPRAVQAQQAGGAGPLPGRGGQRGAVTDGAPNVYVGRFGRRDRETTAAIMAWHFSGEGTEER